MFTAALFTIIRTGKPPKCPSAEERLKMWCIHVTEYYSAIKRDEIASSAEMWLDLDTLTQSEVSQKGKNKYHIFMHIWGISKMVQMI